MEARASPSERLPGELAYRKTLEIPISKHSAKYQNTILHKDQEFLRKAFPFYCQFIPLEKRSQYRLQKSPVADKVTLHPRASLTSQQSCICFQWFSDCFRDVNNLGSDAAISGPDS